LSGVVRISDGKGQAQFAADKKDTCPKKVIPAEAAQIGFAENQQQQYRGKAVHDRCAAYRPHVQAQGTD